MKDSTIKKTLCTSHAHQACRYPNDLYRNRYKSWLICCVFLIFIACQEARIIQLETSDSLETPMTAPMPEEMKSGPQVLAEDEFESAEVGHTALRRLTFEQSTTPSETSQSFSRAKLLQA